MKHTTQKMIKDFKIYKRGVDFMGYKINKHSHLSYHHTIISHRRCQELGIKHDLWDWNGSILDRETSHDYLHIIERVDDEIFYLITSELIDINIKGYIDKENLIEINKLLEQFEEKHMNDKTHKNKKLIKDAYLDRVRFRAK